jgi:hypothetical protein
MNTIVYEAIPESAKLGQFQICAILAVGEFKLHLNFF